MTIPLAAPQAEDRHSAGAGQQRILAAAIALRMGRFIRSLLRAGLCAAVLLAGSVAMSAAAQTRPFDTDAPPLGSVGRLKIPALRYREGYAEHYDERCSATLISTAANATHSRLLLSAWHCLEDYRDISRPMLFETANGQQSEATVLISGGGMHSDWALLRLKDALPGPVILDLHRSVGDIRPLLMAGYPREPETRQQLLETDSDCHITGRDLRDTRSDCVLQKGASGGAVFARAEGYPFLGIISRGDGESQSIFVPLRRFRGQITPFLGDAYPMAPRP
jgi:hypothetical protein